mmetsp:Transcript_10323/g.16505  ORF Transcript_10323/g.16505 Transcript_10323/m.16505 type:complete len:100 (+) Transcript_10323:38-337(+)
MNASKRPKPYKSKQICCKGSNYNILSTCIYHRHHSYSVENTALQESSYATLPITFFGKTTKSNEELTTTTPTNRHDVVGQSEKFCTKDQAPCRHCLGGA